MKILLYFESEKLLATSGIGRARRHQQEALTSVGIDWTTDPWEEDYDILHINTFGINSNNIINRARKNNIPVVYHAHTTEEDFRNSFIFSNQIAPLLKMRLIELYSSADVIITPTPYSKTLLEAYGIEKEIYPVSNGIDLNRFVYDEEKVKAFRKYFSLKEEDKVILSVGLYFERKGILDFMEVAKQLPEYKFIWFGYTNRMLIPKTVRDVLDDHPANVILPGYVKGAIIEGAYMDSEVFFFPSYEETEGIVVLEALSAKQKVVVRNIGVYDEWLEDGVNCYMCEDNNGFVKTIRAVVENTLPSTAESAYVTAESKSIHNIGIELKRVYEELLSRSFDE